MTTGITAAVEKYGFAVVPEILTHGEVAQMRDELNRMRLPRSRAGIRHALGHPPFAAVAREPRLVDIAQEILGAEAFPFHATLFDKSPRRNWLVAWHQDTALPLQQRRVTSGWGPWSVKEGVVYAHAPARVLSQVVALRVHLDDCTAENGALRVLPGTHTQGVLSGDTIYDLAGKVSPVDCVVPSGGVLVMRPLLVHSSSKSRVDALRRVLHIEYAIPSTVADGLALAIT